MVPNLTVILGRFLTNSVTMPLTNLTEKEKFVEVVKTEEKGSDVNLAVHALNDAWLGLYDCAVIIRSI